MGGVKRERGEEKEEGKGGRRGEGYLAALRQRPVFRVQGPESLGKRRVRGQARFEFPKLLHGFAASANQSGFEEEPGFEHGAVPQASRFYTSIVVFQVLERLPDPEQPDLSQG